MNLILYNSKKFFFLLIFINIYQDIFSRPIYNMKELDLDFIHPIALLNGNIFIIHKNGVVVYNYNFTEILYSNNLEGSPIIASEEENDLTSVIQCSDNDKNVFAIIKNNIYIFSSRGQYIFHQRIILFSDFRTDVYYKYFSFLYYKYENPYYNLIVAFINNESKIRFIKIHINIHRQICDSEQFSFPIEDPISDSVTCQIINYNNYSDDLSCVYAIKGLNINNYMETKIIITLFDPENIFNLLNQTEITSLGAVYSHGIFKSVNPEKSLGLLFINYIFISEQNLAWFIFDFNTFKMRDYIRSSGISCSNETKFIYADYFEYSNQYAFSCLNFNGVSISKFKFTLKDDVTEAGIETVDFNNCNFFYNFNIIFLNYEGYFLLFNNFICENSKVQVYNLTGVIYIDNYIKPSDEPDNSYLPSSTIPKTTYIKIPTTIPETTHPKISTTIPKTTYIKIPTTIPKTTHIKISTAIPKTTFIQIKTTIPKTTLIKIATTIPKTTYTKIQTTIPKTTYTKISTTIPITTNTKIKTSILQTTTSKSQKIISKTSFINALTTYPKVKHSTILTTKISTTLIKPNFPTTIKKIHTTFLKTIPITTPPAEIECQIKCSKCNNDILDLCIQCNIEKHYYPTLPIRINGIDYYECYNQETAPSEYYLENYIYKPCFSRCKTCNYQGNEDVNNCTSCKKNYIFRPDEKNSTNCVIKCPYYYYILFEQYLCTENNQCPLEASLLLRSRGKCIDSCYNDNEFNYQYNYECVKECPEDYPSNENNICEFKNKKKCYLYTDSFQNVNFNSLESNNFDILIKKYITGFNGSDFHVALYQSQNYTITIYKTMECLKELKMDSSIIDFSKCYKKIQKKYNLENRNLIVLISDFFNEKELVETYFNYFNPDTGELLSIGDSCIDMSFKIEKSLNYYQEINIEEAKFFDNQDINIFNSSDVFYNDLCYFFESPNGKDVPLKVRLQLFYPNISFCEEGCNNIGVNLTSMKAICECKLKELLSNTEDASKLIGLNFAEFYESISLDVIKCYKTLFQSKYFIKCYGGLIAIFLILAQTICAIIAGKVSMGKIRIVTYWVIENYINLLRPKRSINSPPKKNKYKAKSTKYASIFMNLSENSNMQNDTKYKLNQKLILKTNNEKLFLNKYNKGRKLSSFKAFKIKDNKSKKKENKLINLDEYLKTSLDDLDYDEAIIREKRNICKIFIEKLVVKQMIIDIFYNNNYIIPKTIKAIFFIVRIDLYLFVNALFYNEEYITELYVSTKKEEFFSFVPRSLNRIIYTSIVSSVLNFIISLLFPSENKIKKILLRKKYLREMKNKIIIATTNIINNYYLFIGISYIFSIITWFYISCFNNAYPYLKIEWIKSSIFIIIIIQFISIFTCLLYAILRFISIKCKSEKIFKFSNYLLS